jgi:WD40 repeat protein
MAAIFSPDGKRALSGSLDRTLRLWDVTTGEELKRIESPSVILDAAFGPSGTRAVTGSGDATMSGSDPPELQDRTVRVWNLITGEEIWRFEPQSGFVRAVAYSPDGNTVASGTWNSAEGGKVQVWNLRTGALDTALYGHNDIITSLVYSPDSKTIFSSSWDRSLRAWDIVKGIEILRFQGHNDRVLDLALSSNDQYILTGTGNIGNTIANPAADQAVEPSVWLWDLANRATDRVFRGHRDWVWSVALSPDRKLAASGSGTLNPPANDTSVRLWNVETGEQIWSHEDHTGTVNSVTFSPDGQTVASASWDNTVRLWDVASGESLSPAILTVFWVWRSAQTAKLLFPRPGIRPCVSGM